VALATEEKMDEALAVHYVADLLHHALLEAGEPVKASEAAKLAGNPNVDLKIARVVLATHPNRFTSTDRKWTLWSRFADPGRATERNIDEVLESYGAPIGLPALARELAAIHNRPAEYYERVLARIVNNEDRYFSAGNDTYGLRSWLLVAEGETEEDVLFDNYLKRGDLARYDSAASKLKANDLPSVVKFLDAQTAPVSNKTLQYFVWQAKPEAFDAVKLFTGLLQDGQAALLSGGLWVGPKAVQKLQSFFPSIAEREVDEYGDNKVVEEAQPLVISDEERESLIQSVAAGGGVSRASDLLESTFEVVPGESIWDADLDTLLGVLKNDDRVLWIGADRFVPQGTIPEYVFTVPEILHIPVEHYTDAEGNELDLLLDDDGFDGGLQREILTPQAQDVLDEEPAYTPDAEPPATARCVLKFHHKEIGTFPLCQLPPGFFPVDAPVIQVELTLPTGHKTELWVNNETRIVFGLLDWYNTLPVDSGAVFYLERQAPDKYVLTYGEETEPSMFISRNRVNELMELGRRAEDDELPTFDILREIMEHYRKGIEYITLLTEVNIARRTTRRMTASLVSGYHCFFQRGGSWVFDAKKLSQGFDKSKRKYLKK
jgi:hypothetical protein